MTIMDVEFVKRGDKRRYRNGRGRVFYLVEGDTMTPDKENRDVKHVRYGNRSGGMTLLWHRGRWDIVRLLD